MDSDETGDSDKTAIIPVREQKVDFYGDSIAAAQLTDGTVLVPLRPICEALGLNWSGQRQRAQRDPVLREALSECIMHTEPGPRAMLCLPLDLLPGWLFGVTTGKMAPDLAAKITLYRRECFRVLWEAFKGDILPTAPPTGDASGARLALEIAEAVANLARQQLALEERFDTMTGWLRGFAQETRAYQQQADQRFSALELRLDPKNVITEEQAAELALAVKNVGQRLAAQGDRQGYAKVYSELYRRYRVSSYKNLPQAKLAEVLAWLGAWYAELGGDAA